MKLWTNIRPSLKWFFLIVIITILTSGPGKLITSLIHQIIIHFINKQLWIEIFVLIWLSVMRFIFLQSNKDKQHKRVTIELYKIISRFVCLVISLAIGLIVWGLLGKKINLQYNQVFLFAVITYYSSVSFYGKFATKRALKNN